MIIQNFDRSYQVLRYMGGTEDTEEFLCAERGRPENTAFLLIRITDPVLSRNFTLFLEEKGKREEFTDYRECFLADGAFYAVFRYSLEPSLREKLERERCSLRERAAIAKELLERLLLLNPHPYFARTVLNPDQVTVSSGLTVCFNYHLSGLRQPDECGMEDVSRSLRQLMGVLFEEEEKNQISPLLNGFLAWLSAAKECTWLEIYERYLPVHAELCRDRQEDELPKTFWFRLWERSKRLLSFLRKVLAVVIVVAAMIYVVQSLRNDSGSQVEQVTIREIGDLEIESSNRYSE